MLQHPGGRLLVAVIGLAISGVGGFPTVKGWTHAGRDPIRPTVRVKLG